MAYFFRENGSVHLGRLTVSTALIVGTYANSFLFSVKQVGDPGMDPTLQAYEQVYNSGVAASATNRSLLERVRSFVLADKVLFSKVKVLPN